MIIVVNIIGLLLIALIVYWFWLTQPRVKQAREQIKIVVANGVYAPSLIEVPTQQPLILEFFRQDEAPCAQIVLFKDLNIHAVLPLQQSYLLKCKSHDLI